LDRAIERFQQFAQRLTIRVVRDDDFPHPSQSGDMVVTIGLVDVALEGSLRQIG